MTLIVIFIHLGEQEIVSGYQVSQDRGKDNSRTLFFFIAILILFHSCTIASRFMVTKTPSERHLTHRFQLV